MTLKILVITSVISLHFFFFEFERHGVKGFFMVVSVADILLVITSDVQLYPKVIIIIMNRFLSFFFLEAICCLFDR